MRLRNGVTVPRQVRRMAVRQHLDGLPAGTDADATNRNELPVRQGPATVNRALVFDMAATAFIAGVTFWLRTPQAVSLPEIRASVVKLVNNIDEIW